MKIESFQLNLQSDYRMQRRVSTDFESRLVNGTEADSTQERTLDEFAFHARLRLILLQMLLAQFSLMRRQDATPMRHLKAAQQSVETQEISQSLTLKMQGCIQTATRQITLDIDVSMQERFVSHHQIDTTRMIDPLIINLEGDMPSLSQSTFRFDIDNDGLEDQISRPAKGNGFLALDRDENGTIDAGSELFGTRLGNGFAELSLFDTDNNMWIDENDPIFEKLRVWTPSEEGKTLLALGEAGVGAIYLGSTASQYRYGNPDQPIGTLKSSGLFLYENGQSGIIAQIDLAKQDALLKEKESGWLEKLIHGETKVQEV